jgi:Uma2 family endonuclease
MSSIITSAPEIPDVNLPDHTQLPDSDGKPMENMQELPQAALLTDTLWPVLEQLHPDGQFFVAGNSGLFWWPTDPPLKGCKAPDWFYVANVPPLLEGKPRRSYVLWKELRAPSVVLEFASRGGAEEHDRTPLEGKFWVYEQGIRVPYYGIFEVGSGRLEMNWLVHGCYELMPANARGHFEIDPLGVELGVWHGTYRNMQLRWLRWWDLHGNLLLTSEEREALQRQRAEQERQRAEQERQRADKLAERLRSLGVNPDEV